MSTDDVMSRYNAYEHKKWAGMFERSIDRISDPIPMREGEYRLATTELYWAHVTGQSDDVTESIKKAYEWAIPEGYNNILCNNTVHDQWGLKYMCW